MTTLVTGASGFIGRHLLRGSDRALVRQPAGFAHEVVGNLLDIHSLDNACMGIKTVFHCAGYSKTFGAAPKDVYHDVNYLGTVNLLQAAGRAGVKRFIFLSSIKAMAEPGDQCVDEKWPGEPVSPYGRSKRAAEVAVLEAGQYFNMHVVNLRLAMVYGRGGRGSLERMARGLRAGWFPILPETKNRRSLIHLDDAIDAIRLVAERPQANRRTYIVCDSKAYSGREICDLIQSVIPAPRLSWQIPERALRLVGKVGDVLSYISRYPFPISSELISKLLDSECYSPALIEQELGWRNRVSLKNGLREMLCHNEVI